MMKDLIGKLDKIQEAEGPKTFLMKSTVKHEPEGSATKDFNIVLWRLNGQLVTHFHTPEDDATFHGNYFGQDSNAAVEDFLKRCKQWGLEVDFS